MNFIVSLLILLSTSTSLAQNISSETLSKKDDSAQGIRVSLVTTAIESQLNFTDFNNLTGFGAGIVNSGYGFGIGYASLPTSSIGWTTNLTYINLINQSYLTPRPTAIYRADINLAYSFSNALNLKGGLNVHKTKFETTYSSPLGKEMALSIDQLPPSLGVQAGIGYQFNKYVGLDINCAYMAQEGSVDDQQISLKQTSYELGLNGTF